VIPSRPERSTPRRLPALDGLRGVAVLLVLLSHASKHFPVVHPALNFRGAGKSGVLLFFLLSAYLLDRQIALAMRNGEKNYWGNYFLRRVLRIYPLFAAALLFHLLLTHLGIPTVIENWRDVTAHLALLDGKGVFWSIPVEMTYYLVSPVIMILCGSWLRWRPRLVFAFLAGLIAVAAAVSAAVSLPPLSLVEYLPVFLSGAIIAVHEVLFPDREPRGGWRLDAAAILAAAVVLATIPSVSTAFFGTRFRLNSVEMRLLTAACWGTVLIAATHGSPIVRWVLERPSLRFIGTISFSAYLFHYPILTFVDGLSIPEATKFPLFMLLTVAFSFVTYSWIERPLSRVRLPAPATSRSDRDPVNDFADARAEPDDALIGERPAVEAEDRRG
jgi:peptidoglycan/LPS O-acetylase OafA/YrhL